MLVTLLDIAYKLLQNHLSISHGVQVDTASCNLNDFAKCLHTLVRFSPLHSQVLPPSPFIGDSFPHTMQLPALSIRRPIPHPTVLADKHYGVTQQLTCIRKGRDRPTVTSLSNRSHVFARAKKRSRVERISCRCPKYLKSPMMMGSTAAITYLLSLQMSGAGRVVGFNSAGCFGAGMCVEWVFRFGRYL